LLVVESTAQEAVARHLQKNSMEIRDEDTARLSPLLHERIRMLGQYTFTLPKPILRGEHRPLNQLELAFGEYLESLLATLGYTPQIDKGLE